MPSADGAYIERRHANGVVARVTYVKASRTYQASCHTADTSGGTVVLREVWSGYTRPQQARAAADRLAHPGCTGDGCDPDWPNWPGEA